ncbi:MAG: hypothetical protein IT583_04760 [Verrucomicrobia bacterium]|nr:hypothetical protein [Verrucomicrobiota bacterium]
MHIIFQKGLDAARKNFGPGILLQGFALALVMIYYFHTPSQQLLLKVPAIKQRMGIFFPILSTAFFGGLIPFLFLAARKEIPAGRNTAHLLFMVCFWAINGLAVDLLYKCQAFLFGIEVNVATVVKKVLFDQLVYCPLWSAPFAVIAMHWKNCDFSFVRARQQFTRTLLTVETPAVLISIWAVWILACAIIYSLPSALQFPLFNVVLCFWSLLLTALSTEKNNENDC